MKRTKSKTALVTVALLFAAVFLAGFFAFYPVKAEEKEISVKIGIVSRGQTLDDKEKFAAYMEDLIAGLSKYLSCDFVVSIISPNAEKSAEDLAYDKLTKGEIDLAAGCLEETEGFSYSLSTGEMYRILKASRNGGFYGDLFGTPLKIAVKRGDEAAIDALQKELTALHIENYELKEIADGDLSAALNRREADLALSERAEKLNGTYWVYRFAPMPVRFAFKNRPPLVFELNKAISAFLDNEPEYSGRLKEKYFPEEKLLSLSDSELEYVQNSTLIKVVMPVEKAPLSYSAETDPKGMAVEFMKLIERKTGLKFSYNAAPADEQLKDKLSRGEYALYGGVPCETAFAEKYDVMLSAPFLRCDLTIVANKKVNSEKLNGKKLVLPIGLPQVDAYAGSSPLFVRTVFDCLDLVNKGLADYTYANYYAVQYYISGNDFKNIAAVGQLQGYQNIGIGMSKAADPILLNIVNKAIMSITAEEKSSIIFQNSIISYERKFEFFKSAYFPLTLIGVIALTLCAVIALIVLKNKKLHLRINQNFDHMSKLSEKAYYICDSKTGTMYLSEKLARIWSSKRIIKNYFKIRKGAATTEELRAMQFFSGGSGGETEFEITNHEGARRCLHVECSAGKPGEDSRYRVGTVTDVTEEKERERKFGMRSLKDSLTDLYNAASLRILIEKELASMSEGNAFFLMDIDNFKEINDECGYLEGDRVLISTARVLEKTMEKEAALIGRLGGDEFIIYVKNGADKRKVSLLVSALRYNIRAVTAGNNLNVTLSIGCIIPEKGMSFDDLYKKADLALNGAKAVGRNTYEIVTGGKR